MAVNKILGMGTIFKNQNDPLKIFGGDEEATTYNIDTSVPSTASTVKTTTSDAKSTDVTDTTTSEVTDLRKKRNQPSYTSSLASTLGINT